MLVVVTADNAPEHRLPAVRLLPPPAPVQQLRRHRLDIRHPRWARPPRLFRLRGLFFPGFERPSSLRCRTRFLRLGKRVVRLAGGVTSVVAPPVGVDFARRRLADRRRARAFAPAPSPGQTFRLPTPKRRLFRRRPGPDRKPASKLIRIATMGLRMAIGIKGSSEMEPNNMLGLKVWLFVVAACRIFSIFLFIFFNSF
jgi:hypothetical protein